MPVIRQNPKEPIRELSLMRWGLIPSWARDASGAASMINARSETASTKPAFRDALKSRRCLIPADGFYEWMRTGKAKQPYCFEVNEGELFAFAGIWDRWKDPHHGWIKTCSILTTTRRYNDTRQERLQVHFSSVAFQNVGRRGCQGRRMYSVISVNMSVHSGMRVLNPQKSPDFLLVSIFHPLRCNVAQTDLLVCRSCPACEFQNREHSRNATWRQFCTGLSIVFNEGKGWPLSRPEPVIESYTVADQKMAAGTSLGGSNSCTKMGGIERPVR